MKFSVAENFDIERENDFFWRIITEVGLYKVQNTNNYYRARCRLICDRQFLLKFKKYKEESNQSQLRTSRGTDVL